MKDNSTVEKKFLEEVSLNANEIIVTDNPSDFSSKHMGINKRTLFILAGFAFVLSFILIIIFIPSNASKSVSEEIENITGVSFENYDKCLEIQEKYNSLSQLDKMKVLNYGNLEDEIEFFCIFIDSSIEVQSKNLNDLSYDILMDCKTTYEKMPEEHKKLITQSELMYGLLDEAKKAKSASIIKEIKESKKASEISEKLETYRELLSMDEYIDCLSHYARWAAFDKAEIILINSLRDPNSYTRYSGTTSLAYVDGEGCVTIRISYGARNGFGGMVNDSAVGYVFFKITPTGELIWDDVSVF